MTSVRILEGFDRDDMKTYPTVLPTPTGRVIVEANGGERYMLAEILKMHPEMVFVQTEVKK